MANDDIERLLTVEDLAARLTVKPSWIYARCAPSVEPADCDLPHIRVGRYLRFEPREIDAYLDRQRRGPRP